MQFITTGNRIAVENFTVGYLYTITFTNGDYIHTACTGIGIDFVMFTRVQPDYMFALTMDTAVTVSTIDIYSGGGSTMNYNDLTNKPQINNVELVGNKTLNDLGIQPVITDDNKLSYTLISGLGTAATTATSDYATAAQGALADTAVQPAALNDYQTLIDNDNKLSADLIDDTYTTNKFATSTQLAQIETNKNNILLIEKANGKKNLVPNFEAITNGGCTYTYGVGGAVTVTGTKSGALSIATVIDNANLSNYGLTAGDQIVLISDNANIGTVVIFEDEQGTQDAAISAYNEVKTVTIPSGRTKWYVRLQVKPATTGSINETAKPMICDKKLYDIDQTFTPYAMSNAEITAWIFAHS